MNDQNEQTYILHAIESLRNEVVTRDNSTRGLVEARTDDLKQTLTGITEHLATLNGRTRKAEAAITRLNLVAFGIGGPTLLVLLTAILTKILG